VRLAPEEESNKLTGFEHNAVTPIGMREDIPVSVGAQSVSPLVSDLVNFSRSSVAGYESKLRADFV
jgi:hypothetical protein